MMDIEETDPSSIVIKENGVYHYCKDMIDPNAKYFEVIQVWGQGYVAHEEGRYRCYKCKRFVSEQLIMALRLAK